MRRRDILAYRPIGGRKRYLCGGVTFSLIGRSAGGSRDGLPPMDPWEPSAAAVPLSVRWKRPKTIRPLRTWDPEKLPLRRRYPLVNRPIGGRKRYLCGGVTTPAVRKVLFRIPLLVLYHHPTPRKTGPGHSRFYMRAFPRTVRFEPR